MIKKKVGLYAGSFNGFTIGHLDIVKKALAIFDEVIVLQAENPNKDKKGKKVTGITTLTELEGVITLRPYDGLLVDFIEKTEREMDCKIVIVRGVRNGYDLDYEFNLLKVYNDLAKRNIPSVLIPCSSSLAHVSSSMVRGLPRDKQKMYLVD